MSAAVHYTYRVSWSAEDDSYVGTVAELPSLSWLESDQREALNGIIQLVRDVVDDLESEGEPVPVPLAERVFSGKFMVRIPPEVHRELALEAAEQRVSLNRLVTSRLTARRAEPAVEKTEPAHPKGAAGARRLAPSRSKSASPVARTARRTKATTVVKKAVSPKKTLGRKVVAKATGPTQETGGQRTASNRAPTNTT